MGEAEGVNSGEGLGVDSGEGVGAGDVSPLQALIRSTLRTPKATDETNSLSSIGASIYCGVGFGHALMSA